MKKPLWIDNNDNWSSLEVSGVQDIPVSSLLSSQNHPKLPELTLPIKKDVASLFVRDITKKKIESMIDSIEKLQKEFVDINKEYQKISDLLQTLFHKILDTSLVLEQEKVFLQEKIKVNWFDLPYETILVLITNIQKRIHFIESVLDQYVFWLQEQNKNIPNEEQLTQEEIAQYMSNYEQSLQNTFDWITQHYLSILAFESNLEILNQKKEEQELMLQNLDKQYEEKYALLMENHKKLKEFSKQWFLSSFESFDNSLSVDNLVSQKKVQEVLRQIISLYKNISKFEKYSVSWPKSVLFSWSAMTGKTFAAKILASELGRKMYHIKRHDVFSEENTDINLMLTDIFYTIIEHVQEKKEPCVIFLDEVEKMIDSVGKYNTVSQQIIINTIEKNLIAIQKSDLDILVIVALWDVEKNNTHVLDKKVFTQTVDFVLPNQEECQHLFVQYAKQYPEGTFVLPDYDDLVQACVWQTASYIRDLLQLCVKESLMNASDDMLDISLGVKEILDVHHRLQANRPQKYFGQKL